MAVRTGGHGAILKSIMDMAGKLGWNLLNLAFSDNRIPSFVKAQGAIIECLPDDPIALELLKYGCKIVRIGRLPHPRDRLIPAVLRDYAVVGRMAADHLLSRGFKSLGFIGYKGHRTADEIWRGFRSQAQADSCSVSLLTLGGEDIRSADRPAVWMQQEIDWMNSQPIPFGVLTYDDHRAGQFCNTCHGNGISVPEQVAIIGYGNDPAICTTAATPTSSVDPDFPAFGREAALLLQKLMNGASVPPEPVKIAPRTVVQRHSTDVMAVPHPAVARALRCIWDRFERPISPTNIAEAAGVSRTGLDRLFRRYLGRTVNAELVRKRLERCSELLLTTDLPVADIASFTGFQSRTYLHTVFHRAYGMTPRQFRRKSHRSRLQDNVSYF